MWAIAVEASDFTPIAGLAAPPAVATPLVEPVWFSVNGEFAKLFESVDMPVMLSIGIFTFMLLRSGKVPDWVANVTPWVLGAAYGVLLGLQEGYSQIAYFFKGVMVNGGASWLVAFAVHKALKGYVITPEQTGGSSKP